jgi:hypothetical protein
MKEVMLVFGFCICMLSVKGQDSLSLKSGKSVTGQIVSFADSIVRIKIGSDTLDYKLDEIKSIRYNGPETGKSIQVPVKIEAMRDGLSLRRHR